MRRRGLVVVHVDRQRQLVVRRKLADGSGRTGQDLLEVRVGVRRRHAAGRSGREQHATHGEVRLAEIRHVEVVHDGTRPARRCSRVRRSATGRCRAGAARRRVRRTPLFSTDACVSGRSLSSATSLAPSRILPLSSIARIATSTLLVKSWPSCLNLSARPSSSTTTSTDALGLTPIIGAANARIASPVTGTGLSSASRIAIDAAMPAGGGVPAGGRPLGAVYPLRARTWSPGCFTRTSSLRNCPSRLVSFE